MKVRLISTGVVLITTALTLAIGALPAQAGSVREIGGTNPRICSLGEYKAVKNGMSKTRVTRIMDGRRAIDATSRRGNRLGVRYGDYGTYGLGSYCEVGFRSGNVYTKAKP